MTKEMLYTAIAGITGKRGETMTRTSEEQAIRTGLRSLPPQKEAIILTVITLLTQLMRTDDTPEHQSPSRP